MKHILLLGAGLMQKPAIDAAHELGYHVTVVDMNKNSFCVPLADRFEPIDLKDIPSLINLALEMKKSHGIDAVFTAGTDFSYSVAKVAYACELPSHLPQAALNASDKIRMRNTLVNKTSSPNFTEVSRDNLKEKIDLILSDSTKLNKTLVVKPCDNMGGRGCKMVSDYKELLPALTKAIKYSRTERAIVEDYMDGNEYSIDALVFDNTLTITGFADRYIYYSPYFIEMGHTIPTTANDNEKKLLIKTFWDGVKALGLSHGAVKADIKLTSKGPMIGEIAARLSGGYMSGWTYPYASDMNITKQALLLALGETPTELINRRTPFSNIPSVYEVPCTKVSAERAWISIPGTIKKVENLIDIPSISGIKVVFPRAKEGDKINFPVNNVEKAGNVISCLPFRKDAICSSELARKKIFIRLLTNNEATDKFLSENIETKFPPSAFAFANKMTLEEALKIDKKDWNGLTLKETLSVLPSYIKTEIPIHEKKFLHALFRGGIQGAVYYCETYGNK